MHLSVCVCVCVCDSFMHSLSLSLSQEQHFLFGCGVSSRGTINWGFFVFCFLFFERKKKRDQSEYMKRNFEHSRKRERERERSEREREREIRERERERDKKESRHKCKVDGSKWVWLGKRCEEKSCDEAAERKWHTRWRMKKIEWCTSKCAHLLFHLPLVGCCDPWATCALSLRKPRARYERSWQKSPWRVSRSPLHRRGPPLPWLCACLRDQPCCLQALSPFGVHPASAAPSPMPWLYSKTSVTKSAQITKSGLYNKNDHISFLPHTSAAGTVGRVNEGTYLVGDVVYHERCLSTTIVHRRQTVEALLTSWWKAHEQERELPCLFEGGSPVSQISNLTIVWSLSGTVCVRKAADGRDQSLRIEPECGWWRGEIKADV